ncbi:EthD family reductase [Burkholderia contaminans]|uniref:EthD family reductase n=1 Tax=Burkholderia contaminans TaxID=488447 RepID=UPI000F56ECA3|nr:EthD family reductase [Burkholderia contaminans]ELK6461676.1 EthD family reductase [Burkholderia contaminans]RQT04628.1 EthD family reductase [Burkholderia contaminans]RQT05936.1 EthD family reductase [Burkholderia contaminans]VWC55804.1 ethyl tert-butyl ether degradation EthD [Burkholderia contaminans]
MATLIVSYPAAEGMEFDREYYFATHISLVRAAWGECGLQSVEVLFPAPGPQPFACVTLLRFSDQAGIDAALASSRTAEVVGDVRNFTQVQPAIFRAGD